MAFRRNQGREKANNSHASTALNDHKEKTRAINL